MLAMKVWHCSRNSRFNGINKQYSRVKDKVTHFRSLGPTWRGPKSPLIPSVTLLPAHFPPWPLCHSCVCHALPQMSSLGSSPPSGSTHESSYPISHPWPPCVNELIPLQSPSSLPVSSITLANSCNSTCFLVCLFSLCLSRPLWCKPHNDRDFSLFYSLLPPQWLEQCLEHLVDICGWLAGEMDNYYLRKNSAIGWVSTWD